MTLLTRLIFPVCASLFSTGTFAQYGTPESLKAELGDTPDLVFAQNAVQPAAASKLANALFATPTQAGHRQPAVVILPTCGGVSQHIRDWTEAAVAVGYTVLVVDSLRGLPNDCGSPSKITNGRYIKDALDAVAHLATQPQVDAERISLLGFSKGALIATWLASSAVSSALRLGSPAVASVASMYGFCSLGPTRGRPQGIQILQPNTDRPLLMLLGGQDNETPPTSCLDRLPKLKESGAPVSWHLYPDATHAWDKSEQNGFSKVDFKGERVTYRFDKTVTDDSRNRVFRFFSAQTNAKEGLNQRP